MSTAYRVTTNGAPMAGKAPIQPLTPAEAKRGTLRLVVVSAGLAVGVVLVFVAMGWV